MLRKRLEDDLGVKLADKKAVIREEVGEGGGLKLMSRQTAEVAAAVAGCS